MILIDKLNNMTAIIFFFLECKCSSEHGNGYCDYYEGADYIWCILSDGLNVASCPGVTKTNGFYWTKHADVCGGEGHSKFFKTNSYEITINVVKDLLGGTPTPPLLTRYKLVLLLII